MIDTIAPVLCFSLLALRNVIIVGFFESLWELLLCWDLWPSKRADPFNPPSLTVLHTAYLLRTKFHDTLIASRHLFASRLQHPCNAHLRHY